VAWAQRAESLGFSSLWLADHFFLRLSRYGGPADKQWGYDPFVGLSALARATHTAKLGPLVLAAPLRSPAVVAKALATLDVLSDGRVIAGLGAGWNEEVFADAAVPLAAPRERLAQLGEAADVVAGLFGGGPFSYGGRHYTVREARCLPRPVQRPRPPIWIGGKGDRLLGVVARHGDGWNTVWAMTPADYSARLRVLADACERIGRDPAEVTLSLGLHAVVGDSERDVARRFERLQRAAPAGVLHGVTLDEWRRGHLVGTVEQVREQFAAWEALGVHTIIVNLAAVPFAVVDEEDLYAVAEAGRLATNVARRP
jgi:probable F420-dependent oxidoreductase